MENTIYGYVRVSSTDQNEDRQMLALSEVGVYKKIYLWIKYQEKILNVRSIRNY